MNPVIGLYRFLKRRAPGIGLWLAMGTGPCLAAATLSQQIDPPEINMGESTNVTITIQNGSAANISLPHVEGLQVAGTANQSGITIVNGAMSSSMSEIFSIVPLHAGDFTIPAFDVNLQDGGTLHVQAMKLHVLSTASAPSSATPTMAPTPAQTNPAFNPNGPVVMPPGAGNQNPADSTSSTFNLPIDKDGQPAKVFVVISPKTTDAYVGETIPMRIEFYIRGDVDYQQNSLPTIKGSDFLMNDLSVRPQEESVTVSNYNYRRESWITAISAPKTGDFPLQMERETYWVKVAESNGGPFANIFGMRPVLAHENVPSNLLTIHVHSLPEEGRTASFTGAIGQLQVTGTAAPGSVAVGEPVTLNFTVSGEGNFAYVKCPALAPDPAWKSYIPSARTEYTDESHTQGTKTFEQALIPQKNGTLPLPAASFSYFDPTSKQYVTVPVSLPTITVTGSAPVVASIPAGGGGDATATVPDVSSSNGFLPNRLDLGYLQTSLAPAYRQPWFWAVQGVLILALFVGGLSSFLKGRIRTDDALAEQLQRQRSLHHEQDTMGEAVRQGDARAFFLAARHAVQLQLGGHWRLNPEAITLAEIRQRDPQRAESLEPLFLQADEVIYSGLTASQIDLAQWERYVREQLLQPQPA